MRRAPIVIVATVVGTAGVLAFKPLTTTTTVSSTTGGGSDAGGTASSATTNGTSSGGSSSATDGTVTGTAVTTRFGTTQVEVTISGGRITDVRTVQINSDDPRSEQISEAAIPTLRTEVLSKQTAAVDTVSGATYTSLAYEASLQAALDKAGYVASDGSKARTSTPVVEGH